MRRNKEQRQICNLSYNYRNRACKVNNENIEKNKNLQISNNEILDQINH